MLLRPHRRNLVIWTSTINPASGHALVQYKRPAHTGRFRRCLRIAMLVTVIAVRPRWLPLLAGTALMVTGVLGRDGAGAVAVIPGLLLLWHALLIPGDSDADRERRLRLERELAAFSTPAQRRDLEAALDRYPDDITYEIRDVLSSRILAARNHGAGG